MKFLSPTIKTNAKILWEAYTDRLGSCRSEFRNTIFDLENLIQAITYLSLSEVPFTSEEMY